MPCENKCVLHLIHLSPRWRLCRQSLSPLRALVTAALSKLCLVKSKRIARFFNIVHESKDASRRGEYESGVSLFLSRANTAGQTVSYDEIGPPP